MTPVSVSALPVVALCCDAENVLPEFIRLSQLIIVTGDRGVQLVRSSGFFVPP